jgi:U4/U6.U5 tri-snRNP-associated protein 1
VLYLLSKDIFLVFCREDDKRGRHERYMGPTVPFKEKPGYKPTFKLAYHDASGRDMNAKEAFRDLSHKFHGKGPGKLKTERRAKKYLEEKVSFYRFISDTFFSVQLSIGGLVTCSC